MVELTKLMADDTQQIALEISVYQDVLAESQKGNLSVERGMEAKRELEKLIPLHEARVKVTN